MTGRLAKAQPPGLLRDALMPTCGQSDPASLTDRAEVAAALELGTTRELLRWPKTALQTCAIDSLADSAGA